MTTNGNFPQRAPYLAMSLSKPKKDEIHQWPGSYILYATRDTPPAHPKIKKRNNKNSPKLEIIASNKQNINK